jgi:hypothetical protein
MQVSMGSERKNLVNYVIEWENVYTHQIY